MSGFFGIYFLAVLNGSYSKQLYLYHLLLWFCVDFQMDINTRQQRVYGKMIYVHNQTIKCAKSNVLYVIDDAG